VALVAPYAPEGRLGRPPFSVETMPRIHFMQQYSRRNQTDSNSSSLTGRTRLAQGASLVLQWHRDYKP